MTDLKSSSWIVAKGVMFLAIAVAAAVLILLESPRLWTMALLAVLVWSLLRAIFRNVRGRSGTKA